MEYIVSTEEMRLADRNTSAVFGLSSQVLMERAAMACVGILLERCKSSQMPSVLVFAGSGGNGGDGIAIARILHQKGCKVLLVTVGDSSTFSGLAGEQLETAMKYDVPVIRLRDPSEAEAVRMVAERRFDVLVDAIFGIGVSRPLTGVHAATVALIRRLKQTEAERLTVLSVDMPSGIQSDTGEVCGIAVKADLTVTMNHRKRGLVLYPGAAYAGEVVIADAGITAESFLTRTPALTAYHEPPKELLPVRDPAGNKGTFGKLLIVAGNARIGGAPILAARAAFAMGAGMVRVFTEAGNRTALLAACPEALIDVWQAGQDPDEITADLQKALGWADACVIGPGIGTDAQAARLLETVLAYRTADKKLDCPGAALPLIIDADGLNLLAADPALREKLKAYSSDGDVWPVLTPHMGEFARLAGSVKNSGPSAQEDVEKKHEIDLLTLPQKIAGDLSCTILCKDARSITAQAGEEMQILNLSGNCGMATAGSGDVLAGIAGALAASGMNAMAAASLAAYVHGLAGDRAAEQCGTRGMTAGDIITGLREILR